MTRAPLTVPHISVRDVTIEYAIRHVSSQNLRSFLTHLAPGGRIVRDRSLLKVTGLKDVNLELAVGDRVGILGANGAGKTTLLRVLAGLLPPQLGIIEISGTVAPLLSIQLGFDENLDGYGNIRLRARLMGYSREEVEERVEEIAAFTELGEHLYLPFRTYSSGMRLRLAFAVATAFEPDILILDEWISAGDEKFRNRAAERLKALIRRSGIFAFASHSVFLHERLCNRGLVIDKGRLAFSGPIEDALRFHKELSRGARVEEAMVNETAS